VLKFETHCVVHFALILKSPALTAMYQNLLDLESYYESDDIEGELSRNPESWLYYKLLKAAARFMVNEGYKILGMDELYQPVFKSLAEVILSWPDYKI
jgi:oxalate decarboxylase/phosphoglucose isomerase-like protein (cupin superfamily)